jgi:hypothetical protein
VQRQIQEIQEINITNNIQLFFSNLKDAPHGAGGGVAAATVACSLLYPAARRNGRVVSGQKLSN